MKLKHFTNMGKPDARRQCLSYGVRCLLSLGSLSLSAACAPTEGPLFVLRDAGISDARTSMDDGQDRADAGTFRAVRQDMRLQYQLQGLLDLHADADLFVLDLFETEMTAIAQLHAQDRVVIAYIAAGTFEPWRPDVSNLPLSNIGAPLAHYPREAWLDVRTSSVRQLMTDRLTLAARKGFDGVLLASLDGYLSDTDHDLTSDDQLDYNLWLAEQARRRGLVAGISSDWPHADLLADHYDFAIHTNCVASRRCAELSPYRERARAVFDLETRTDAFTGCAEAARLAVPVTFKRDSFDAWRAACP